MKEIWKDINGYKGCYQISNLGRVKSLGRYKNNPQGMKTYWVEERILKPQTNIHGRIYYSLKKDGLRKNHTAHRLVGIHFISNPNNLPQINHKDENPKNNIITNLEWCTPLYNTNYGTGIERRVKNTDWVKFVQNFPWEERSKEQRKKISQFTLKGELVRKWDSLKIAGETLGIPPENICMCCKERIKTAGGYLWKYCKGVI